MKNATIIAIIAMVLELISGLYWQLVDFGVVNFDETVAKIIRPVYLLSSIGLLVFFILLYQRQTKN